MFVGATRLKTDTLRCSKAVRTNIMQHAILSRTGCDAIADTCVACTFKVWWAWNPATCPGIMSMTVIHQYGQLDLPEDVTEEEILEHFGAYHPVEDGVHILVDDKRKPTGQAIILYQTEADTNLAFHKQKVRFSCRMSV